MDIIVMIKQVPDTTDIEIDPKTGNLIRSGIEGIINPYDLNAIEASLEIKERIGGSVTVISMGPPQAIDAITEAIGMGVDRGILLTDRAFAGADTLATSFTLGKAVEKLGSYDLILCGYQAIDGDTAQVGPQLAEYLNIPQITSVTKIEKVTENSIIAIRSVEDGYERVFSQLPALLTVKRELNRPRFVRIDRLLSACEEKAPIDIWNAADIGVKAFQVGMRGSMTEVIDVFTPKFKRKGKILKGSSKDVVDKLLSELKENNLI